MWEACTTSLSIHESPYRLIGRAVMSNSSVTTHISVLLDEIIEYSAPSLGREGSSTPLFLDVTLGGAGHTLKMLQRYPRAIGVGIDRDQDALDRAEPTLAAVRERIVLLHGEMAHIAQSLTSRELRNQLGADNSSPLQFDFILADLGVSSDQLDIAERGFSFRNEAALDMRMDQSQALSAHSVVNDFTERDLASVLRRGGVGAVSARIARAIVQARPIQTTLELANIVAVAMPKALQEPGRNPATVTFQALRMEVNAERAQIEKFLAAVPQLLAPGGRFAVISFQSLEDEMVTKAMRRLARPPEVPRGLPIVGDTPAFGRLLTPGAVVASEQEREANPRSRSARLRVFERRLVSH